MLNPKTRRWFEKWAGFCGRSFVAMGALGFMFLCKQCDPDDDCTTWNIESLHAERDALKEEIQNVKSGNYAPYYRGASSALRTSATAAAAPTSQTALQLTSGPVSPYPKFTWMPNRSTGKFVAQASVSVASLTGVTSGKTLAGFRYDQNEFEGAETRVFVFGVSPFAAGSGFTSFVSDVLGFAISGAQSFPNTERVDLRIEQTDTDLVFRARPTTKIGESAAAWTEVYKVHTAPDPAPFKLGLGMVGSAKGASFYFTNLAIEGDAVGGDVECPILTIIRASVAQLKDAKAKLSAATPDFAGALTSLDAASAAIPLVQQEIKNGLLDRTLQSRSTAALAMVTLKTLPAEYEKVRIAINTLDVAKTSAQLARLQKLILTEQGVMVNLLGWKAPPFAKIPEDFISLNGLGP